LKSSSSKPPGKDAHRRVENPEEQAERIRQAGRAGETVAITDRGRVVAEIVPPQPSTGHESFIERGVREGWLLPATDRSGRPPPRKPIPGYTLEQLLADLGRDREDRW
jgi:antitoxin (DNA-binding transcriptional repressor) of toxin-antitoxin stability system